MKEATAMAMLTRSAMPEAGTVTQRGADLV
jgi:hypothetical protein